MQEFAQAAAQIACNPQEQSPDLLLPLRTVMGDAAWAEVCPCPWRPWALQFWLSRCHAVGGLSPECCMHMKRALLQQVESRPQSQPLCRWSAVDMEQCS